MRKILFFIAIMLAGVTGYGQDTIHTKKKCYIRLGIGYGFSSGPGQIKQAVQNINGSTTYALTPFSYGKGLTLSYGVGYEFTRGLALEMNIAYFIGGSSHSNNTYRYDTSRYPFYVNEQSAYNAHMLQINPAVLVTATERNVTPYARMGFVAGWGSASEEVNETANFYTIQQTISGKYVWELEGLQCFGYNSAVGAKIKTGPSDNFHFFAELNYQSVWGTFNKAHMSSYSINSKDMLSSLSVSEKEEMYVNSYTDPGTNDPTQPHVSLKQTHNFDSLGLKLGFISRF